MSKQIVCSLIVGLISHCCVWQAALGQANSQGGPEVERVRELFVPVAELEQLLGDSPERVFMSREEYARLSAEARVDEPLERPFSISLLSASYRGFVSEGRATLTGELLLEALGPELHELKLPLAGVGLRSAVLDGQPASLANSADGVVSLFVRGAGQHRLQLNLTMAVATDAARQTVAFRIPTAAASRLSIEVPGNVEVKSGAAILRRQLNAEANATTFDMLLEDRPMQIVMSLNNKKLREQSTVIARAVVIAEVTAAYERLHATLSMKVLNGATDEFRFAIDDDMEVYSVVAPELNRWSLERVGEAVELVVKLQTPATQDVVLNIRLDRKTPRLGEWHLPQLQPMNVAGKTAVIGLVTEERLFASNINTGSMLPIDASILSHALASSLFTSEAGQPPLKAIAAGYATGAEPDFSAAIRLPESSFESNTNTLFTLSDAGLKASGGVTLTAEHERLFHCDLAIPDGWNLQWIRLDDGTQPAFERFEDAEGLRVRVPLTGGIEAGASRTLWFEAQAIPDGWMSNWDTQTITLPHFQVLGSATSVGVISLVSQDDLRVSPTLIQNLLMVDEQDKAKHQLQGKATDLAYRFESEDWQAVLQVVRQPARLTARVYSFFRIEPEALSVHYELAYLIERARTQQVAFSVPESIPAELSIRALDGASVKETSSEVMDGRRRWTVVLAEQHRGRLRLAVDFTERMGQDAQAYLLPTVRAEDVDYQTGTLSLEGHPELETQVTQHPRSIDIGDLVDADYQVGKRLIGAFGYVGTEDVCEVNVSRRPVFGLPSSIVERAELITLVGTHGMQQTAARYLLRTKAAYLEVALPAAGELWSVTLDGRPALPQQTAARGTASRVLIAIPADLGLQVRDLSLVYEMAAPAVALRSEIELQAPLLFERQADVDAPQPIPTADLLWEVSAPAGYRIVRADGEATVEGVFSWQRLLDLFWKLGGGQRAGMGVMLAATQAARESAAMYRRSEPALSSMAEGALDARAETAEMPDFESEDKPAAPAEPAPPLDGAIALGEAVPPAPPVALNIAPPAQPTEALSVQEGVQRDAWALEGVRSLQIELNRQSEGDRVALSNLGNRTRSQITLIDQRRVGWLGAVGGLVLVLVGLVLKSWAARRRYVFGAVLTVLLLPLVSGWGGELADAQRVWLLAFCLLVGIYLLQAVAKAVSPRMKRTATTTRLPAKGVALLLAASLVAPSSSLWAQQDNPFGDANSSPVAPAVTVALPPAVPAQAGQLITDGEQLADLLKNLLSHAHPLHLPDDAIIVPYDPQKIDPTDPESLAQTQQLWVPYRAYQELLRQSARRGEPANQVRPPRDYALAGVTYQAALGDSGALQVTGRLEIEQFVEGDIALPLPIEGCVLERALLDGQPARIHLVVPAVEEAPAQQAAEQPQQVSQQQAVAQADGGATTDEPPMLVLTTAGVGRKTLEFTLRWRLDKRGGWRSVEGRLPVAAAGELKLTSSREHIELRFGGVEDRTAFELHDGDEPLRLAVPRNGRLSLQWRDKVRSAEIDQGLTVQSRALFEVQEDAQRMAWLANFGFRSGRRDSFTLELPQGYIVEKVIGANVRGWLVQPVGEVQQLDIELLKIAEQRESLTIFISKQAGPSEDGSETVVVPQILVPSAMQQQGTLTIRRSELLELSTAAADGVTRIDLPDVPTEIGQHAEASPLPMADYQAFEFSQPFRKLELQATLLKPVLAAETQSILKISQRETNCETRLLVTASGRSVHRLRVRFPDNLELSKPEVEGEFEWFIDNESLASSNERLLEVYLAEGMTGTFPVILRSQVANTLQADGVTPEPVAVPRFVLEEATRQRGAVVVQVDPAYDVRLESLQDCEVVLLNTVANWLTPEQQRLARRVLQHATSDFAATARLTARLPSVSSSWVSNVKVTDRTIEETILLLTRVESAGIRELEFRLPKSLSAARVQTPLLRRMSMIPSQDPLDNFVTVRLELQDAIMGQLSVVIEHDRLRSDGEQVVAVPTLMTGETDAGYLALENASRDELVITPVEAVRKVEAIDLGKNAAVQKIDGKSSEIYVVVNDGTAPRLTYQTRARETIETVNARIGLAQTLLVVDEFGGYRGTQEYRVENRTEPFLEVRLPEGAQLWTANVAGEPVKPAPASSAAAAKAGFSVRIPLIRTAEGDLDYPVIIKYGGQLPPRGWYETVEFPLLRTENINVELSQVRLRLPEDSRWYNFDGSLGRVASESELQAGWLSFRTRQLFELSELLSSSGKLYSKARASNNLKQLERALSSTDFAEGRSGGASEEFRKQLDANSYALKQAQQQAEEFNRQEGMAGFVPGNRELLSDIYLDQANTSSFNVIDEAGANFSLSKQADDAGQANANKGVANAAEFDPKWFRENRLSTLEPMQLQDQQAGSQAEKELEQLSRPGDSPARGDVSRLKLKGRQIEQDKSLEQQVPDVTFQQPMSGKAATAGQPESNAAAAEKDRDGLEQAKQQMLGDYRRQVERYNERLQQQQSDNGVQQSELFAQPQTATRNAQRGGRAAGQELSRMEADAEQSGQQQARGRDPAAGAMMRGMGGAMGGGGMGGGQIAGAASGMQGMMGGMGMGGESQHFVPGIAGQDQAARGLALLPTPAPQSGLADVSTFNRSSDSAFLASLDVDMPLRGREFLFSTPGGNVELQARRISSEWLTRAMSGVAVLLVAGGVWFAYRLWLRLSVHRGGRWLMAGCLEGAGLLSLLVGWLPIYGVAAMLLGVLTLAQPRSHS